MDGVEHSRILDCCGCGTSSTALALRKGFDEYSLPLLKKDGDCELMPLRMRMSYYLLLVLDELE